MCNLYSITTNQGTINNLFPVINRYVGTCRRCPVFSWIAPAPVVRKLGTGRIRPLAKAN
jgi:hypothetical protein